MESVTHRGWALTSAKGTEFTKPVTPEKRYPLPSVVCGYGSRSDFALERKESAQWVHYPDRVALILAGRYAEVKPLHVELSPTWVCNFACPWCSTRTVREDWVDSGDVFHNAFANDETSAHTARLTHIIDHLAEFGTGIQWVGGEPTLNPALFPAMEYAHTRELPQALFTNGSALAGLSIEKVLRSKPVFVRFSLNAATPIVHARFHGYDERRTTAVQVLRNIESFARRKVSLGAQTACGVSFVIDDRNVDDIEYSTRTLIELSRRVGQGAIDYIIFRPAYRFYQGNVQLSDETVERIRELLGPVSQLRRVVESAGIQFIAPTLTSSVSDDVVPDGYADDCLAAGLFGEVKPDGSMIVCSDRYGHPDYTIGNVDWNGIAEIWKGSQRSQVLEMVKRTRCFREYCPRNGRGFAFNKLFHEIEAKRRQGRIEEVQRWIEDLQAVVPRQGHSFYM